MNKIKHISILFLLSAPLLAVFTNHFLGYTLAFLWGFLAWCVVLGQWYEKEGPVFGIKNDTILQQHNREAEAMEQTEPKRITPEQISDEIVLNAKPK